MTSVKSKVQRKTQLLITFWQLYFFFAIRKLKMSSLNDVATMIYNNCRDSFDAVNESFLNNSLGWGLSESLTINPIESDEENDLRSLPPTPFRVVKKTDHDEPYERILPVDDAPVRVKEEGNAPVKIPNGGDIRGRAFAVRPTRQSRPEMGNAKVNAANARKKKTTRPRSTPLKDITNKTDGEAIKTIAGKKRTSEDSRSSDTCIEIIESPEKRQKKEENPMVRVAVKKVGRFSCKQIAVSPSSAHSENAANISHPSDNSFDDAKSTGKELFPSGALGSQKKKRKNEVVGDRPKKTGVKEDPHSDANDSFDDVRTSQLEIFLSSRLRKKKKKKRRANRNMKRRKSVAKKDNTTDTGFVDVFEKPAAVGSLRSCLQDAIVNAVDRIGLFSTKKEVAAFKKTLYKQRPPRRTKNTHLEEILETDVMKKLKKEKGLRFISEKNYFEQKGGPTYALLQVPDDEVRIVLGLVHGRSTEWHALVYDAGYTDPNHVTVKGAFIDNRKKGLRRLLEPADRVDKWSSREALNGFYRGAMVEIRVVYRVEWNREGKENESRKNN